MSGIREDIERVLDEMAHEHGAVPVSELEFREDIRKICEGNSCRRYGTTWACPPGVGTLEECARRCASFEWMHVFTGMYHLSGSFDISGMRAAWADFKDKGRAIADALKEHEGSILILTNESCNTCGECTYPDEPCRFEATLQHSLEGYGFLVSELAAKANVRYNNGEGTVTYFGAIMYCDDTSID